jgi:antitoxin VapB
LRTAKLFKNGRSQAVRLPAEFRFEGDEVYIRRVAETGDVVLSQRRGWSTWDEYFGARDARLVPDDFLADRRDKKPQARKLFGKR